LHSPKYYRKGGFESTLVAVATNLGGQLFFLARSFDAGFHPELPTSRVKQNIAPGIFLGFVSSRIEEGVKQGWG
jgi:hypothetical protein